MEAFSDAPWPSNPDLSGKPAKACRMNAPQTYDAGARTQPCDVASDPLLEHARSSRRATTGEVAGATMDAAVGGVRTISRCWPSGRARSATIPATSPSDGRCSGRCGLARRTYANGDPAENSVTLIRLP